MELLHGISEFLQTLGFFGGIAFIILASNKAKIERIKAERQMWQPPIMQQPVVPQESAIVSELRQMKEQIGQMQSTSHQFDISFDAALSRLEGRVERLETKTATPSPQSLSSLSIIEQSEAQRVGLR